MNSYYKCIIHYFNGADINGITYKGGGSRGQPREA